MKVRAFVYRTCQESSPFLPLSHTARKKNTAIAHYLNALHNEYGIMKWPLAFYCTLPVWSCASFGTQLSNHPPGTIEPRLLGVDKSVSSIRVTVIKCFRGCTRLLAAAATTKIYVASVETWCRGGRWSAKSDVSPVTCRWVPLIGD